MAEWTRIEASGQVVFDFCFHIAKHRGARARGFGKIKIQVLTRMRILNARDHFIHFGINRLPGGGYS